MTSSVVWAVVATIAGAGAAALAWPASPGLNGRGRRAGVARRALAALVAGVSLAVGAGLGLDDVASAVEAASGWVGPVVLGVAALAAGSWLRKRSGARRQVARRGAEVLELCDDLAGDLEAGASPGVALHRAAVRWPAFAGPASAHALGGSVPDAWRELARLPGAADLRVVAAAWQVAERTGAGLADALAAVGAGLRDQQRTRRLVASELASARATARLMAALPLLTLAVGSGAGDPIGFLVGTPVGLACAAAGLGLGFVGVAWIEAIATGLEEDAR